MKYEVRGNFNGAVAGEMFDTFDEATDAGTSATIIIDHLEREVYVPHIVNNTFRGEFDLSVEKTAEVFAQEIDWRKMRRRLEDRLRKDPMALRYVVGKLGIELAFNS